ncbi:MAG: GAF domain-containing sensor histidine kinase, partial [Chloroflexia bacterium]
NTTYCKVVGDSLAPLIVNNATEDPVYCDYPALQLYGINSYIAVPLNRVDGTPFGVVCALDPKPAELSPDYLDTFSLLAQLIAFELEAEEKHIQNEIHLRSLEDFISIAAHDLRQPITALYGNAQLLARAIQRNAPLEKLATHVEALLAQSRRAVRLSDTLLDLAHIESGRLILSTAPLDLTNLAHQAINDAQTIAPLHTFEFDGPPSLVIRGDENRLTQVLRNLLDNAAKYAPPDSGPITFSIKSDTPDKITVSLSDHGPGVESNELTRLFERQFRAVNAIERSISGSGLGLYISSQIVEAHGGKIKADPTPGGGLTVSFTLPPASPSD